MSHQGHSNQRLRPFKPARFGRYTLLLPIASGGMGEVFLARLEGAQGFEKLCVIKKILPHLAAEGDFVERFVGEAHVLVKLQHGSIAQVLDMGVHEGEPYLALEFVDGKDLRRVLARARESAHPLPLPFVLYVATRLLDALAYAHRKRGDDDAELNLVHRDVSPQNVIVSYEGEIKVIDFGLAKSALAEDRTNPNVVLGKLRYLAPEQARHQKVDHRSDLYAVGLTLYELVAGESPFEQVPSGELLTRVASPSIAPLAQVERQCPQVLSEVVMRALAPDAAQRFQSAEEFRGRLQAMLLELDATAGAETASRFMREAFAVEHQGERKMLAALKEQGRNLGPEPEAAGRDVKAKALSFAPTRRPEVPEGSERPVRDAETRPAIAAPDAPSEGLSRNRGGGQAPALQSVDLSRAGARPPPNQGDLATPLEPSVMLSEPIEPVAAPGPRPLKSGLQKALDRPPRPSASGPSAAKASAKKKEPEMEPAEKPEAAFDAPTGVDTAPLSARSPPKRPTARKPGSPLVWLVIPLVALLAVVGYVAWDVYSEQLKARQLAAEGARDQEELPRKEARRSREVKVAEPEPKAAKKEEDEEELLPPPGSAPQKGPAKAAAKAPRAGAATMSPGRKAFRALKADFDKLVNEAVQKKYRMRVNVMGDKVETHGDEPAVVEEVQALHEAIKADQARPENQ